MAADRDNWPDEQRAGEIIKRLLAGERGHFGPLEHAQIVLNVGWFPHSVMQQARTHRVASVLCNHAIHRRAHLLLRTADRSRRLTRDRSGVQRSPREEIPLQPEERP